MQKRPLLLMACAFLCGILLRLQICLTTCFVFAGLLLGAVLFQRKRRDICKKIHWIFIFFLFLLFGMQRSSQELEFRESYVKECMDGQLVVVQGEIYKKEQKNEKYYYYLKNCYAVFQTERKQTNNCIAYFPSDDYSIGQILIINGTIKTFQKASNQGNFDLQKYYFSQKIDYAIENASVKSVHGKVSTWKEALYQIRCGMQKVYAKNLPKNQSGVVSAMLLGDKSTLEEQIKEMYQMAGISHILAISGLHVSLIGMGAYQILRKRRSFLFSQLITMGILIGYYHMTGCGTSTFRAVVMLIFCMTAAVVGRSYDLLNALGGAALLLLIENPLLVEYSGFAFSFLAVLGVGMTGKTLTELFAQEVEIPSYTGKRKVTWKDKVQKYGQAKWKEQKATLRMSAAIQITTIPFLMYYSYEIPVYSVLLNLFVLPLLPIIVLLGIQAGIFGIWNNGLPRMLLYPVQMVLQLYEKLCEIFLQLPGNRVITGCPSELRITLYYGILFLGIFLFHNHKEKKLQKKVILVTGICLLFLVVWHPKHSFEIDALDVGQGDATYICTSNGTSIFVDGGSANVKNVAKNRILPFLKYKGVRKIDFWFVSHLDNDHISGLMEILESDYPVSHLVLSDAVIQDEAYEQICQLAVKHNTKIIRLKESDCIQLQNAKMTCLGPKENEFGMVKEEDRNDNSMILLYEDGDFCGLFAGDISSEVEATILESEKLHKLTYLKAIHHGSNYSNSSQLLEQTCPQVITISCALHNNYHHPGIDAVERMEQSGADIYYTMKQGQIRIFYHSKYKTRQLMVEGYFE